MTQWVTGCPLPILRSEVLVTLWVGPLVWVLSGTTPPSTTCRRIPYLPIRPLTMFLLYMGVQSRVGQICFIAKLALMHPPICVIFRPPLVFVSPITTTIIIIIIPRLIAFSLTSLLSLLL